MQCLFLLIFYLSHPSSPSRRCCPTLPYLLWSHCWLRRESLPNLDRMNAPLVLASFDEFGVRWSASRKRTNHFGLLSPPYPCNDTAVASAVVLRCCCCYFCCSQLSLTHYVTGPLLVFTSRQVSDRRAIASAGWQFYGLDVVCQA